MLSSILAIVFVLRLVLFLICSYLFSQTEPRVLTEKECIIPVRKNMTCEKQNHLLSGHVFVNIRYFQFFVITYRLKIEHSLSLTLFLHCPLFREGCGYSTSRLNRLTLRSSITSIISLE